MNLRDHLSHVYWLGGGTGGGKSTVARRLAERHGLQVYDTDRAMSDHTKRSSPADTPYLQDFLAMDMDERWANRSPETMLDTFHWFRGEAFGLIVEDLLALAPNQVVAEGFRLLPALVEPLLADRRRAVWLLPTPEFRRMAIEHRGSLWSIAGRTSAPERALGNLLERNRLFTERLASDLSRLGLRAVTVRPGTTEDGLVDWVGGLLGLGRPVG